MFVCFVILFIILDLLNIKHSENKEENKTK